MRQRLRLLRSAHRLAVLDDHRVVIGIELEVSAVPCNIRSSACAGSNLQ